MQNHIFLVPTVDLAYWFAWAFRLLSPKALGLTNSTVADARGRREAASFVQSIVRYARGAGFDTTKAQMT